MHICKQRNNLTVISCYVFFFFLVSNFDFIAHPMVGVVQTGRWIFVSYFKLKCVYFLHVLMWNGTKTCKSLTYSRYIHLHTRIQSHTQCMTDNQLFFIIIFFILFLTLFSLIFFFFSILWSLKHSRELVISNIFSKIIVYFTMD